MVSDAAGPLGVVLDVLLSEALVAVIRWYGLVGPVESLAVAVGAALFVWLRSQVPVVPDRVL
jgi:hypothetical protein